MWPRWTICLGLVSLVCGSFPAAVAAAARPIVVGISESGAVATGFKMHGNHGYSITAVAYSEGGDRRGTIEFTARRHDASVSYKAPAIVTAGTIRADVGGVARVDVVRRASGRQKTVHPKCFGGGVTYEPGTYEGVIEFNGEEGYTRGRERHVAQLPALFLFAGSGPCGSGYGEASGPGEPGARLRGVSFTRGRNLSFQVNKNSPEAKTVFTASLKERRGGIRIDRELSGAVAPSAFRFDPHLRTATLSPRAPFSGSASLSRSRSSFSPIWTGDLKLDFPGRSAVSLAGPGVHVSLVHARFTRSHGPSAEIGI
jgi:hypothetical protein